jgi:hypothetical protein
MERAHVVADVSGWAQRHSGMATTARPCLHPRTTTSGAGQDILDRVVECAREDSASCGWPHIIQGFRPAAAISWRVPPVEDGRA